VRSAARAVILVDAKLARLADSPGRCWKADEPTLALPMPGKEMKNVNAGHPVERLDLHDFTAFGRARLDFVRGINVLLGVNATGKSHAMKALYATMRGLGRDESEEDEASEFYRNKLRHVFGTTGVVRLIRNDRGSARIRITVDGETTSVAIVKVTDARPQLRAQKRRLDGLATLFFPSRDVLAMYEGFVAAYVKRELSFDETYFDACTALSANPLRSEQLAAVTDLLAPLEGALGGRVALRGNRFYLKTDNRRTQAHLMAEGMRKIAMLAHLIRNGSIAPGTTLFWDEPEASLNPALVTVIADLLVSLAEHGVQVILATHDYLLARRLSLRSEYGVPSDVTIRFFAFHRAGADEAVTVTPGATFAELPDNPILDEHLKHYDFERDLFVRAE
jgi:energy-coupling factor transporter ATP-binding protein EcfA2